MISFIVTVLALVAPVLADEEAVQPTDEEIVAICIGVATPGCDRARANVARQTPAVADATHVAPPVAPAPVAVVVASVTRSVAVTTPSVPVVAVPTPPAIATPSAPIQPPPVETPVVTVSAGTATLARQAYTLPGYSSPPVGADPATQWAELREEEQWSAIKRADQKASAAILATDSLYTTYNDSE